MIPTIGGSGKGKTMETVKKKKKKSVVPKGWRGWQCLGKDE